jgi:hypothetical protein
MPSFVNRFDAIVKNYFDGYRVLGELPPIIAGQIKGKLPQGMPKVLRNEEENGIVVWGKPDDYVKFEGGETVVFDHKTRAESPNNVHPAHQLQMDVYSYLLKMNGYRTTSKALIGYYFPNDSDLHNGLHMSCTVVELTTDPDHVKDLLVRASDVLNGPTPNPGIDCEYCKWISNVQNELRLIKGVKNAQ